MKARQRELEENSDMMAAADTFGFEKEESEKKGETTVMVKPDLFDGFDPDGGKEGYGKLANKISAKMLEYQG